MEGGLGDGKSHSTIEFCKTVDPTFNLQRIVFLGGDFMAAINDCAITQTTWGTSWVQFEEPNLSLGHRDFQTLINKTVAGFVQESRFLGVNAIFPLPIARLLDTAVVTVSQCRLILTGRNNKWAWIKAYRIKPNYFGRTPPYYYPKLKYKGEGNVIKILNPALDPFVQTLVPEYEKKKLDFHRTFFNAERLRAVETKQLEKIFGKKDEDYEGYILQHPQEFQKDGKLSYALIQTGGTGDKKGKWSLPGGTTSRLKNVVKSKLEVAEGVISTTSAA
jgi:hypothetical protein